MVVGNGESRERERNAQLLFRGWEPGGGGAQATHKTASGGKVNNGRVLVEFQMAKCNLLHEVDVQGIPAKGPSARGSAKLDAQCQAHRMHTVQQKTSVMGMAKSRRVMGSVTNGEGLPSSRVGAAVEAAGPGGRRRRGRQQRQGLAQGKALLCAHCCQRQQHNSATFQPSRRIKHRDRTNGSCRR